MPLQATSFWVCYRVWPEAKRLFSGAVAWRLNPTTFSRDYCRVSVEEERVWGGIINARQDYQPAWFGYDRRLGI